MIFLSAAGYSTFGQGVGGATAAVLASYIPTQHTQWRVPRGNAGFHQDLASAAPPPNPIVSVAQAMEKAETFVRTAVFCGVSYGLGMHFIL